LKPEEDSFCPTPVRTREEWYIPLRGNRRRYIYCGDCGYRTTSGRYIKAHAKKMHSSSSTKISVELPKEERAACRNHANQEPTGKEDLVIYTGWFKLKLIQQGLFMFHNSSRKWN